MDIQLKEITVIYSEITKAPQESQSLGTAWNDWDHFIPTLDSIQIQST